MTSILYLTHAYNNRGGVEEHLKALIEGVSDRAECHVVFPEEGKLVYLKEGEEVESFEVPKIEVLAPLHDPKMDEALRSVINSVQPDIIHLMHFLYWPLSVFENILGSPAKKFISFHDYYALTPDFTGMSSKDFVNTIRPAYAQAIFQRDISPYLQYRRGFLDAVLKQFHCRTVPSALLAREMKNVFDLRYDEVPYGVHSFKAPAQRKRKNLRFGFLGGLIPQKGWESLLEGFRQLRESYEKAELHFFGFGGPEEKEEEPGVTYHGEYGPENLSKIFSQFDVGVIPSIFPETFSIVLSEMWRAKKPVCVSRIGALHERVIDEVSGKKFTPGDPSSICEAMTWFMENDTWRKFETPTPRTVEEMTEQMWSLYERPYE